MNFGRYSKLWAAVLAVAVQGLILVGVPEGQADAYVQAAALLASPLLVYLFPANTR